MPDEKGRPNVNELLEERSKVHGDFTKNAEVVQAFKHVLQSYPVVDPSGKLTNVLWEGLDAICVKLGRILAGDPLEPDHWKDIQGYAKLVEDRVREVQGG